MSCGRGTDGRNRDNHQRGASLLVVMLTLAIVSLVLVGSGIVTDSNIENTRLMWARKRTFYVAEGMRHATLSYTKEYFGRTVSPTAGGLKADLEMKLPPALSALSPENRIENPASGAIGQIEVELKASSADMAIANGPFRGLLAPQFGIRIRYNVVRTGALGAEAVNRVDLVVDLSQIAITQFYKFFAGSALHVPGRRTEERGHVHVNGDYCVGAAVDGVYFQRLTVGGRLMHGNDSRCSSRTGTDASLAFIATDSTFSRFVRLTNESDNGCRNCSGSGLSWLEFAAERFKGNALDADSGAQALTVPNTESSVTQQGWDQFNRRELTAANRQMRFLIDPVRSADTPGVREQKLASRADLRIIDGVWYIRDASDPRAWPGMPIWSDHPGRALDAFGRRVGQEDLRELWAARGRPWSAAGPRLYSYYEYDVARRTIASNDDGVISYGALTKPSSRASYVPGFWLESTAVAGPICKGSVATACADPAGDGNCGIQSAIAPIACANGAQPTRATLLLKGTRSGFINGFYQANSGGTSEEMKARGHILPMNFDVSRFQVAIQDKRPGELGSYFTRFNGLVYISSTWRGSLDGFESFSPPRLWPSQGAQSDPLQAQVTSASEQRALPYQLCSSSSAAIAGGVAGSPFDEDPADSSRTFVVPDCAAYESDINPTGSRKAVINAVRIVNGAAISPSALPRGLSLVSNLPIYLTGDFNTSSNHGARSAQPWVPTMIAGDKVYQVSNQWLDERAPWGQFWYEKVRLASSTIYKTSLIGATGQNLLEDWRSRTLSVVGSSASIYPQVYSRHGDQTTPLTYAAPTTRDGQMDPHFELYTNRPPGAPEFGITALFLWNRP